MTGNPNPFFIYVRENINKENELKSEKQVENSLKKKTKYN